MLTNPMLNETINEFQNNGKLVKPTPDEVGAKFAKVFSEYFGCAVKYTGDKDIFKNDDFYQLEFETTEPFGDIELIEEKVSENIWDIINLAKFGSRTFQATIWLAPDKE